ncbi:hypothetical protein N476_00290 [Pseudoalteromonas luteoviolacea H33]|uniref:Uncharacterized protein n=1 Tax=Pseudoalteromonas luteoviolacea H33 TaxID=1365251 RepID=A0A161YBU9_9GAMM|nr:hypothetical protein N476_00290 [Pseudoalteromonas luteoviolacea H33]
MNGRILTKVSPYFSMKTKKGSLSCLLKLEFNLCD